MRKRGQTLLKALHDERADDDRPLYSRIVLVGHSLGAVVAYDLLQHFWGDAGPNHSQKKLDQAVLVELEALDAFVKGTWPGELSSEKPQKVDLDAFQNAQSRVFKALVDTNHGWRISDFVTIGSPLVHSEFLISDNRRSLRREFIERFRSASPPRPDYPSQSMLYEYAQATYVHFAAPFSAVRWNNLYDYCWFPFGGDIVSGPVSDVFGPGIRERHVRIRRARVLWPLNRAFTHTLYWQWPHGVESEKVPDYIRELREAMRL